MDFSGITITLGAYGTEIHTSSHGFSHSVYGTCMDIEIDRKAKGKQK
jgi:hypothetical protein